MLIGFTIKDVFPLIFSVDFCVKSDFYNVGNQKIQCLEKLSF